MTIQTTLARRYLAGRKLRTFLTTLAIVFGVLVIFGMNTLLPALTPCLPIQRSGRRRSGGRHHHLSRRAIPSIPQLSKRVAGVEGVRLVSGLLKPDDQSAGRLPGRRSHTARSLGVGGGVGGIDVPQPASMHSYAVNDGRFLAANDADGRYQPQLCRTDRRGCRRYAVSAYTQRRDGADHRRPVAAAPNWAVKRYWSR